MIALHDNLRRSRRKSGGQTKAVRSGKPFLHHLAEEREVVESWLKLFARGQPAGAWLRHNHELVERIDQTRQLIESLLPAVEPKIDCRDPIRQIAAVAREARAEANDGKAPRSTNPDDPLCRFVVAALEAIGQHHSPATVSEVLRGRRRKRKEGRKQ